MLTMPLTLSQHLTELAATYLASNLSTFSAKPAEKKSFAGCKGIWRQTSGKESV